MGGDSLNTETYGFDFRGIFKDECKNNEHYFSKQDDIRQRLYLLFSNSEDLSQKCSTLTKEFISYANKTIITMEKISLDLTSILMSKAEGITDEYEFEKLMPVLFTKLCPPLFTEFILKANFSSKMNIKSKVIASAYVETKNKGIGVQHIMYTTEPGSISDSSSSADLLEEEDSGSNSSFTCKKRKKTCQKAGDFELSEHVSNSHFNNHIKCQVEIFILVGNKAYCETLANHLGLIWFESLLEGEENIERRLGRNENKIYRLAHTEIIKKMMNGYSNICITTSKSAWQLTPAHVKGIIYTKDNENELHRLQGEANYCVLVENKIVAYVDAIGKIVQKSLLCNVSVEVNYQVAEKAYTKIHLPVTVLIPLYIVRYFSQSFIVTRGHCSNSNCVDIFEYELKF